MRLSEILIEYRKEHGLSQRQFAAMCGISHGYLSMIEGEENQHTKKKANVSLGKLHKIASGMGITLHDLLKKVDDMRVSMEYDNDFAPTDEISEGERLLLKLFRQLDDNEKDLFLDVLRARQKKRAEGKGHR